MGGPVCRVLTGSLSAVCLCPTGGAVSPTRRRTLCPQTASNRSHLFMCSLASSSLPSPTY